RLRRTATSHASVSTSSSWKLESSHTIHVPSPTVSATSLNGTCSLPASTASTPAEANIAPSSRTVVVLPFVPVMPMTGLPGRSRQPSSISLQTGMPRSRAAAATGEPAGTPGLFTTTSTPSSTEASSVPRRSSTPVPASLPGSASGERSVATASPVTPSPSTTARRGRSLIRAYFAPDRPGPRQPPVTTSCRPCDDHVTGTLPVTRPPGWRHAPVTVPLLVDRAEPVIDLALRAQPDDPKPTVPPQPRRHSQPSAEMRLDLVAHPDEQTRLPQQPLPQRAPPHPEQADAQRKVQPHRRAGSRQ